MAKLDRTGQRIVGVLIEKQFTVPDNYPLSENALVDGCNQKNNREPITELPTFAVAGALLWLQEHDYVARVEGGGRVAKFRHRLQELLQVSNHELAVLAELLLRGPQAPGALKPRVLRMGYSAGPEAIEGLLRGLAARRPPLVEQLPLGPRERERRWRHLLGDGSEVVAEGGGVGGSVAVAVSALVAAPAQPGVQAADSGAVADLQRRITALEERLAALEAALGTPPPPA
ncbi:MAG: DUF480 domain-containing protein [Planctomycetes bacterium]|nr:DUF480 domain-containing protein [Planctomycetota bacterium]